MIELLVDTNVLIHLLHPTGNAEAGLTRQLLDWDRAGYIRIVAASASGQEQSRSPQQLVSELESFGLSANRIVDIAERSDRLLNEISAVLGHRKAGDWLDALMVYTALDRVQHGYETWLVTGDRNILRHAEILQEFRVPPIFSLRAAVNRLRVDFPLTIVLSERNHA